MTKLEKDLDKEEQEKLKEQKLNSDRYKKALYMDDSDDEYHEEYANMQEDI